jgi:hypothetical protein
MKVKALVMCVAMLLVAGSAMADSYTYEFDRDVTSMDHSKAYLWGINHDIPDDEEVIGATLTIKDIYNHNDCRNEIFINLKDYAPPGWTSYCDQNNDFVDYFGNHSDITRWSTTKTSTALRKYLLGISGFSGPSMRMSSNPRRWSTSSRPKTWPRWWSTWITTTSESRLTPTATTIWTGLSLRSSLSPARRISRREIPPSPSRPVWACWVWP